MSLQNTWHHRRVADTSAKACFICYKPSTSVLITPDNKDFFYVCHTHLKDGNFCSPIVDTAGQEAKKQESMAVEIEKVKKEYEEKQQKKKEKKKKEKESEEAKQKDETNKDADKNKDETKENAKSDEKERDEKIEFLQKQERGTASSSDDSPRVFSLHKNFYQMRIDRLRGIEVAKRNRQRIQDPSFFPSVPSRDV